MSYRRETRVGADHFQLEPGVFNYQDSSAFFLLPPPRINARDNDVIVVDTPTRIAIKRRPDAKVICVVHDLLPLTDLKLGDVATRQFPARIRTSLRQVDELVFVSNYSMMRFREQLPQFVHLPAQVVDPRNSPCLSRLPLRSGLAAVCVLALGMAALATSLACRKRPPQFAASFISKR